MPKLVQNPIDGLLAQTGFNVTRLTGDLSAFAKRTIHRQLVERWRSGGGMTTATIKLLEDYRRNFSRHGAYSDVTVEKYQYKVIRKPKPTKAVKYVQPSTKKAKAR